MHGDEDLFAEDRRLERSEPAIVGLAEVVRLGQMAVFRCVGLDGHIESATIREPSPAHAYPRLGRMVGIFVRSEGRDDTPNAIAIYFESATAIEDDARELTSQLVLWKFVFVDVSVGPYPLLLRDGRFIPNNPFERSRGDLKANDGRILKCEAYRVPSSIQCGRLDAEPAR
jgi:hypothetical protein